MKLSRTLLTYCLVGIPFILSAQLDWIVPPVVEHDNIHYFPQGCDRFLIIKDEYSGDRVMRKDGSFAFNGKAFKFIQFPGKNCLWSGRDMEGKNVAFTAEEWMITDDYDEVGVMTKTNIALVKKDGLFGLLDLKGELVVPAIYESIYKLKMGRYTGRLPDNSKVELSVDEQREYVPSEAAAIQKLYAGVLTDREVFRKKVGNKQMYYWGIKDKDGGVILPADRYIGHRGKSLNGRRVMLCRDGVEGKMGMLDSMGQVAISFLYDDISILSAANQYLIARRGDTSFLVDYYDQVHAAVVTEHLHPLGKTKLFTSKTNKGYVLLDLDLKLVTPDTFSNVFSGSSTSVVLTKDKLRGFYSTQTDLYTEPQFNKIRRPYNRSTIAVGEGSKIGLYDLHTGKFLTDRIYTHFSSAGPLYLVRRFTKDSTDFAANGRVKSKNWNSLLNQRGETIFGPTLNRISSVGNNIYKESKSSDTSILYNFQQEITRIVTGESLKIGPVITRRSSADYVLTDELMASENPRGFEFLEAVKDTDLFIYGENGSFGLMTKDKELTEARFEEIKIQVPRWGAKVKLEGKWGLLEIPLSYIHPE